MDDVLAADYPLEKLKALWVKKIRAAERQKQDAFGDVADECMAFFDDAYEWMYGDNADRKKSGLQAADKEDSVKPNPTFGLIINKVAEFVRIMGPHLYQRNPVRTVTPRKIPMLDLGNLEIAPFLQQQPQPQFAAMGIDPMMVAQQQAAMAQQQRQAQVETSQTIDKVRAQLMQAYLNWSPQEFGLKDDSRQAIDEALIKGRGTMWTELVPTADGQKHVVGSFYESVDTLLIDPDAKTLEEATWIAKECLHPVWQVEQDYNLESGTLTGKGNMASADSSAKTLTDEDGLSKKAKGETNDLLRYWKIWTKMGIGDRLKDADPQLQGAFDQFGRFNYLVVADKVPFFLNLPPTLLSAPMTPEVQQQLSEAVSWPTPCWGMLGKDWPVCCLDFYKIPGSAWPQAPIKPGLGELKAIQWIMSFLVGKIHTTCRDFMAIPKATSDEIKEKILRGADLELLEIEQSNPGTIDKLVYFIQHPQINGDVWKVLESLMDLFDRRVGLAELMYGGSSTQSRSAEESKLKGNYLALRSDDMSDRVEDWASKQAEREAFTIRWHLAGADVAQVIGQPYVQLWDQFITSASVEAIANDLEYRIETGSARKPNKDKEIAVIDESAGYIFGPIVQLGMAMANVGPINAWMEAWCKSRDLDPEPFLFPPPPPPMPPAPPSPPDKETAKDKTAEPKEEPGESAPPPQAAPAPPPLSLMGDPLQAQLSTQMPLMVPSVSHLLPFIQGLPQ